MNGAHLHLMLNHIPVLGVGFGLLLLFAGRFRKSTELTATALVVFALAAGAAGLTYLTGEPAEDAIEEYSGVNKDAIEAHEEAGTVALTLTGLLGLASLAGLVGLSRKTLPGTWFNRIILVGAVASAGAMAYTANLGGHVRHPETGGAAMQSASDAGSGGAATQDRDGQQGDKEGTRDKD